MEVSCLHKAGVWAGMKPVWQYVLEATTYLSPLTQQFTHKNLWDTRIELVHCCMICKIENFETVQMLSNTGMIE